MFQIITNAFIASIPTIVGALMALAGVMLQSFLTRNFNMSQSLIEARRGIYAKLLSASLPEDNYPFLTGLVTPGESSEDTLKKYNNSVNEWRTNRRALKGIAAEALLISNSDKLKKELRDFIERSSTDSDLKNLEPLMREEISMK